MLFQDISVQERIHRQTEKDILIMQGKIARFQRKLRHLLDIYEMTKPSAKANQLDMFGT
jgi:hypothetical protein